MNDPIRVLIAEDQPIVRAGFRAGFRALLDAEADLQVAGEAADGSEGRRARELDGPRRHRQITAEQTLDKTRVVVLTTFELDDYVFGAALHTPRVRRAAGRRWREPRRGAMRPRLRSRSPGDGPQNDETPAAAGVP